MYISKMKKNSFLLKPIIQVTVLVSIFVLPINVSHARAASQFITFAGANSPEVNSNIIVTNYIKPAINFLSAGVGLIIISMVVIGAIQYITSGGSPQAVADARKKIFNALLAFITFIFIYGFLNFIIPGGVIAL